MERGETALHFLDGVLVRRRTYRPNAMRRFIAGAALGGLLLTACSIFSGSAFAACDTLQGGDKLWVRLLQPLSSYSSKSGETIRAIVIESPRCEGRDLLPQGTQIEGSILSVKKVGMGFVHETASMDIRFQRILAADGNPIEMSSRLVEIDNAREQVKNGVIRGVRATDTPQGRITSRLKHLPTWNPYSDMGLIAYRTAFPIFPEPEIYLPAGTDLQIEVTAEATVEKGSFTENEPLSFREEESAVLDGALSSLPRRTTTNSGVEADIVNVLFLGTHEQVVSAFLAAGWSNGDPASTRAVMREFHAFLAFKNYPNAPISAQLLDGRESDMNWQKGLNSYARRAHLRLWSYPDFLSGAEAWAGAYTRETGGTLSFRRHKFIHHIDADLDGGRERMIRDLRLAGCVDSVEFVARPDAERVSLNATGDLMHTDGSLAVVRLKDCANPVFSYVENDDTLPERPRSKFARYLRMQVLCYRSDVQRGNIVYGLFDLTRMIIRGLGRRHRETVLTRSVSPRPLATFSTQDSDLPDTLTID